MGLLDGVLGGTVGAGLHQIIPVSSELREVLGSPNVARFASKLNVGPEELLAKRSELLPKHVDRMTPDGVTPDASR